MAVDDCFYDYLRPEGSRTWEMQGNWNLTVYAVCENDGNISVQPLYDKLGGSVCMYVRHHTIKNDDENHPIRVGLNNGRYHFNIITEEDGSTATEERPCVFDQELVLRDGVVIGSLVSGEKYHFTGECGSPEHYNAQSKRLKQMIFLPTDAEPCLVYDTDSNITYDGPESPVYSNKKKVYYQFVEDKDWEKKMKEKQRK